MFRTFQLPVSGIVYRGLTLLFYLSVDSSFAFGRYSGQWTLEKFVRKLGGFQVRLTVVRSTASGTVFRVLVLLYLYSGMTLREEST